MSTGQQHQSYRPRSPLEPSPSRPAPGRQPATARRPVGRARRRPGGLQQRLSVTALSAFLIGNAVLIVVIWGGGGADGLGYHWHNLTSVLLGLGRITALLSGYLALIQVLLLARVPSLERLVGFDRLTIWHRWNGHAVLDLILAHVTFSVWGYARQDKHSFPREYWNWLTLPQPAKTAAATHAGSIGGGSGTGGTISGAIPSAGIPKRTGLAAGLATSPYPGMITATIGTALLIAVVFSSIVIVKRKLPYECWYAIHLAAYAGIALSWFHMIPAGNEFVIDTVAADYWRSLFAGVLAIVVYYRVVRPLLRSARFDLRVTEVIEESAGVVSLRIGGRGLERLHAEAGQFFFWRFMTRGFWYTKHPFSLSEAPDGETFRITVKSLGDHTSKLATIPVGTRVFAAGPFGVFTAAASVTHMALLIAGGIGITPVRALLETIDGNVVALYRVTSPSDVVFRGELDAIAAARGARVEYLVGDHRDPAARHLLSPSHLRELVPDIDERDVYVCGPPGMVDRIVPELQMAGVPRRHLHVEKFAL